MQLLVSVRSSAEAQRAIAGGAGIIDAKEPLAGALGAVSLPVLASIVETVGARRPVTAAIGDAYTEDAIHETVHAFVRAGAAFVKVGFAGIDREARVASLVAAAARGAAAAGGGLVAVAYADDGAAECLPPDVISRAAARAGARGMLLDTAAKRGGSLLQLIPEAQLHAWVGRVQAAGMFAALAGRVEAADFAALRATGAEVVGVRGAACDGGREGPVSAAKVRVLATVLRAPRVQMSATPDSAVVPGRSTGRA